MIRRIRNFLINTLVGGVVVLLPLAIFFVLIRFLIRTVDRSIEPISNLIGVNLRLHGLWVDLVAFSLIIAFFFIVGLVVRTQIGKGLLRYIEQELLAKLPWYTTIRDTVQSFTGGKKAPFKKVVIVNVFNSGTKMTGFVTDESHDGNYTVFVPTAPNPTNGFVFHVKQDQLEFLDIKTEDAMKTIIGMGVGSVQIMEQLRESP
jgi:uncharacterized membrane protein